MKICALFSGGKDSVMAAYKVMLEGHMIAVLLTMIPKSSDSYMYHVPNIRLTKYSAEAMGIPLEVRESVGKPPEENADLFNALKEIKEKYGIDGVSAGAVGSRYQYNIVAKICKDLDLKVYAPYWQKDHEGLIREALDAGFEILIAGVAAYGLDDSWLGRRLDYKALEELKKLRDKYKVDIGGEGGEYETFVIDGPLFKKRIEIRQARKTWDGVRGDYVIEKLGLKEKGSEKRKDP